MMLVWGRKREERIELTAEPGKGPAKPLGDGLRVALGVARSPEVRR
jgi:hypothetical protein